MATANVDPTRDIIPRLRDFRTTIALGELDSLPETIALAQAPVFTTLESKIFAWKTQRGFGEAADLINNAYLLKSFDPSVIEASEFLKDHEENLSAPLRRILNEILSSESPRKPAIRLHILDDETLADKIHALRDCLREQPRNSILYVELARMYTLLSQREQAKSAMLRAVKLSPNNRFVLRSASRLFLHIDEKRLAHDVLRYAERTKHDSWLLAAEISVASAIGHRARFIRNGEKLMKADVAPGQITELATAVAMEEIEHGKNSTARKLIKLALVDPTENSVAQIGWAARNRISLEDFEVNPHKDIPLLHESKAWKAFQNEDWEGVKTESLLWYEDQVFSSRPILLASYVASTLQRDYAESARILEMGRRINPKSSTLLNNLAFSYASDDKSDEAEAILDNIDYSHLSDRDKIYNKATRGLIAFRRKKIERGRELYKAAISGARDLNDQALAVRAGIYLAREEIRLNPSVADVLETEILRLAAETKDKELMLIAKNQLSL